jgi:hypothetical protein
MKMKHNPNLRVRLEKLGELRDWDLFRNVEKKWEVRWVPTLGQEEMGTKVVINGVHPTIDDAIKQLVRMGWMYPNKHMEEVKGSGGEGEIKPLKGGGGVWIPKEKSEKIVDGKYRIGIKLNDDGVPVKTPATGGDEIEEAREKEVEELDEAGRKVRVILEKRIKLPSWRDLRWELDNTRDRLCAQGFSDKLTAKKVRIVVFKDGSWNLDLTDTGEITREVRIGDEIVKVEGYWTNAYPLAYRTNCRNLAITFVAELEKLTGG